LHAAQFAAGAHPFLPEDLPAAIRVKGGDDPRFLSGDEDAFAARKIGEDGGRPEIKVRSFGFRAVVPRWACDGVCVSRGYLARPSHRA
jgi:hypothetical protein